VQKRKKTITVVSAYESLVGGTLKKKETRGEQAEKRPRIRQKGKKRAGSRGAVQAKKKRRTLGRERKLPRQMRGAADRYKWFVGTLKNQPTQGGKRGS